MANNVNPGNDNNYGVDARGGGLETSDFLWALITACGLGVSVRVGVVYGLGVFGIGGTLLCSWQLDSLRKSLIRKDDTIVAQTRCAECGKLVQPEKEQGASKSK